MHGIMYVRTFGWRCASLSIIVCVCLGLLVCSCKREWFLHQNRYHFLIEWHALLALNPRLFVCVDFELICLNVAEIIDVWFLYYHNDLVIFFIVRQIVGYDWFSCFQIRFKRTQIVYLRWIIPIVCRLNLKKKKILMSKSQMEYLELFDRTLRI